MQTKFDVGQRVTVAGGPPIKVESITIRDTGVTYALEGGGCARESDLEAASSFPTIIIPRQSVVGDAMRYHGSNEWFISNASGEDIKAGSVFVMRLGK